MMKHYPLFLFFAILCGASTSVCAQTTIAIMDFDGTATEMAVSTDVPFFDDGGDGFFGILDSNNDLTDGTPMDTGDGVSTGYFVAGRLTSTALQGDFFLVNDLDNSDGGDGGTPLGGTNGFANITFGPVDISASSDVTLSFDYELVNFGSTDEFIYELFYDNVGQGEIDVVDLNGGTSSGNISQCIRAGVNSVSLVVKVDQNGGSDYLAIDNILLEGNTPGFSCSSVCGVEIQTAQLSLVCDAFTAATNDAVSGSVNYIGIEPDATVSIDNGAVISADSDDPATEEGGTGANARSIRFEGLIEGGTYTITIAGGDCSGDEVETFTFMVSSTLCLPIGDLVINEFMAGVVSGSPGEFVEIYNRGSSSIDISGYTIEDGSGSARTVTGTVVLQPGDGFVFADAPTVNGGCILQEVPFLALNDGGDQIILRDDAGNILHQITYGAEATNGISLALSPDGNLAGGYQAHNTLIDGANFSPCAENANNGIGLPVELLSFTAQSTTKQIDLAWITTNEEANDRFEVQRSSDGNDWSAIGEVAAVPPTGRSTENTYRFPDRQPFAGDNYYRLLQFDVDGTSAVYGPVKAHFSSTAGLSLYPNPVTDALYLSQPLKATDRLQLLGADGRLLRELPTTNAAIGVATLNPGVYLLRVEGATEVFVLRFVKQ